MIVAVVNVTGNTQSITTHNITAQNARYLRLYITNAGADTAARIYEFEVYGTGPVSAISSNSIQTGPTFMPPTNTPVAP